MKAFIFVKAQILNSASYEIKFLLFPKALFFSEAFFKLPRFCENHYYYTEIFFITVLLKL